VLLDILACLPACLLAWSKECNGKDGLLGFIEKKGSRANGLKTNDEKVTEEMKGVGVPPSPLCVSPSYVAMVT